jgi:hypothetical protein
MQYIAQYCEIYKYEILRKIITKDYVRYCEIFRNILQKKKEFRTNSK